MADKRPVSRQKTEGRLARVSRSETTAMEIQACQTMSKESRIALGIRMTKASTMMILT
jgi:hypothetical protein